MIPGSTNQLLAAGVGYQISRSVRLRSSASAYFARTPASASNQNLWTWSGWVKRGSLVNASLWSAGTGATSYSDFGFSNDRLYWYNLQGGVDRGQIYTASVLRDPSAWYHVVFVFNGTAPSVAFYVNGVLQTVTVTTAQAVATSYQNGTSAHNIGRNAPTASGYFDGYLTEINFIDGQALTPSSFGETDIFTGVWKPKKYVGTYGTNGFYLNFSDNSSNTATTIGKDYSGNGNNWTPNNISVTAGATYDSMLDVPTPYADGGNGRGNYAVLNPLDRTGFTIADGNLAVTAQSGPSGVVGSVALPTTGKWYWENTYLTGTERFFGIINSVHTAANLNTSSATQWVAYGGGAGTHVINKDGSNVQTGLTAIAANDVVGLAYDADGGTIQFYRNGSTVGTAVAFTTGVTYVPWVTSGNNSANNMTANANFGQRPFAYTPPTGFLALNTQNLPTPTILKGNQYFDVSLWTGDGTGSRVITTNLNFSPDFVWAKSRSSATWSNVLGDTVRGIGNLLVSNSTTAEVSSASSVAGYISALSATSFTATQGSSNNGNYNFSGVTYVGWQWKEGATQGFDIVTYTGNNVAGRTISHSLGVAPSLIIIKNRGSIGTAEWLVGHSSIGWGSFLLLNSTAASTVASNRWNNTAPTSSVFTLGTIPNSNTETYVAYLFAEVAGFSRFGSYTGNGSTDGPMVFTGFLPRWVLIKCSSAAGTGWYVYDTVRNTYNVMDLYLRPDVSDAETTFTAIDCLSNGFKLRTSNSQFNGSGSTYVYAAFASSPFKNSLAR